MCYSPAFTIVRLKREQRIGGTGGGVRARLRDALSAVRPMSDVSLLGRIRDRNTDSRLFVTGTVPGVLLDSDVEWNSLNGSLIGRVSCIYLLILHVGRVDLNTTLMWSVLTIFVITLASNQQQI